MTIKILSKLSIAVFLLFACTVLAQTASNSESNNPNSIKLVFEQKIGKIESDDDNELFYAVRDATVDNKGNYYIVDKGNHRVQVFDKKGKYRATIGRQGQGPGEFDRPASINIIDNYFYIGNGIGRALMKFNRKYKEVNRVRFKTILLFETRIQRNSNILIGFYASMGWTKNINSLRPRGLAQYNKNGEQLKHITTLKIIPQKDNKTNKEGRTAYILGGRSFFEIDREDNIYIAYKYKNLIEKREPDGELINSFSRELDYKETKHIFNNPKDLTMPNVFSTGIGIDSNDRIWVATFFGQPKKDITKRRMTTKNKAYFEIFNSDGKMLTHVPLPEDFLKMRIVKDKLFLIDEEGIIVSIYTIVN